MFKILYLVLLRFFMSPLNTKEEAIVNKKNTIVILQRILPHYRLPVFKKIQQKLNNVIVLYGQKQKNESLENALTGDVKNFVEVKNLYFYRFNIFVSMLYPYLLRLRPKIIVSVVNVGNINLYLLFFLRKLLGFKLIVWSFGYDPKNGFDPMNVFKDKIRLLFYQNADAVIFYWEKGKEIVEKFSKRKEHYFVAPNTLDTDMHLDLKNKFDKKGKDAIKEELGIKEQNHFVYVGRLLKDKQIDLIIKSFQKIPRHYDCRVTIIGDGPEKSNLFRLVDELNVANIYFTGAIYNPEIVGKWIYCSDLFIMPGRLGNSVVHSFCYATPVLSQKKDYYYHGEGIGYMENGVNGFLANDDDIGHLAEIMMKISENEKLRDSLSINAFRTVEQLCSIEHMIGGVEKAINYCLQNIK